MQTPLSASPLEFSRFLSPFISLLKDGELISCPLHPGKPPPPPDNLHNTLWKYLDLGTINCDHVCDPIFGYQMYVVGLLSRLCRHPLSLKRYPPMRMGKRGDLEDLN